MIPQYHVIDTLIDRSVIKRQFYLPTWIKRVTGVMFYPVVPVPISPPELYPLGSASLSLENEKINVVTNARVFKKAPCFYESKNLVEGGGEVFVDDGYNGNRDFFE
jgi:hypothetical protein